ncbi:MAG: hypothetical protein ABIT07_08220 [Ferruginibacter sp.]
MMKRIVWLCCFLFSVQASKSLDSADHQRQVDSFKRVLAVTTKPIDRFTNLLALSETTSLHNGDPDSSLSAELLQIARHLQNDSLLAISYDLIGQYSRVNGDNTAGLEYYFKAIPLADKAHDKRRLSSIYFDMATVYFNLQNNEEYGKYIKKGGENMPDKTHPKYDLLLAQYQRGMATYFIQIHQPDSALVYAQPLIATSQRLQSQLYAFNAYYLNAAAQDALGDKEMAALYFKKTLAMSPNIKSFYSQLRFASIYIPILISNRNFTEAKKQAAGMLTGFASANNDYKLKGAGFLRQIYELLHQPDSAYYYAKMEIELSQVLFNQNNINKIQSLAFNEQIRNIEADARQKQEAEQRRQNIQFALIAFGIVTFIVVFLLFSRSIVANEKWISFFGILGLLIVFEFINLLIHPWLAHYTHESPVLMLLALVIIASLLIPLHHRLEKWIKEKMIEKNKAIRLVAAKKTIEKLEGKQN